MTGRILIVDDDPSMGEMLRDDLTQRGHQVCCRTDAEEAFGRFMAEPFDVVVTDLRMPGLNGIDFCRRLSENRPDVPVIVITAFGSLDTAVEAIRAGAYDFVTKPIERDMLALVIKRAMTQRSLQEQVRFLKEERSRSRSPGDFVGESPAMQRLFEEVSRIAEHPVSVLVTGESGTGKELVAQALHRHSDRRNGPFVPVNCAALPGNLLESELFGHAKGAFTGARSDRRGLFLEADGGTLFLDEVGEIPLELQPKLLRALETGSVRPVGADHEIACDVRIVAATNRDLETAVAEGEFREDLFFRINVVHVEIPPLRSRGTDVLLLAQHFLEDIARRTGKAVTGLSPAAAEKLLGYRWPGNVRELRNVIERAVALTRLDEVAVEDLPEKVRDTDRAGNSARKDSPDELLPLEEVERQYVQHVLEVVGGNKTIAADVLGLGRRTLYRKLERWGL
ncbi:MAG: sigma-54-dependent transcriptional regulator [Phycisphaeraceae bacterium]